ncbi:hypothetical protein N9J50_01805 [Methylophilaceae bacterium]|nr:hypothetical protein [Methylophilaceae bacterium]
MSDETMTPEQGSGNLTVSESVSGFESFLDSQENPVKDNSESVSEEVVEETLEASEEEVESEEDTYEAEDSDEVEEETEEEAPQTFTVKASGEEKEVTFDELVSGYQLGADYTKKTQELAENRKAVEAEAKAIIEAQQVRDTYAQRLQAVEQLLTMNDSPEDIASMKENDPIGYAVKVAEMTEKKEQLQAVRAEQQRIAQQQQADRAQAMQRQIAQESAKLAEVLPEFSDKAKGEQIRNEIRNYGKTVGFTDQELSQVYDSRHVLVLHKAAMYDKLQKSKPGVQKKVANAPKMIKSGTKVKQGNNDVQRRQKQQLKGSGKVRDAAKLFENFI